MDGIADSTDMSLSKLREIGKTGRPGVVQSMGRQRVRHNLAMEQEHETPRKTMLRLKKTKLNYENRMI